MRLRPSLLALVLLAACSRGGGNLPAVSQTVNPPPTVFSAGVNPRSALLNPTSSTHAYVGLIGLVAAYGIPLTSGATATARVKLPSTASRNISGITDDGSHLYVSVKSKTVTSGIYVFTLPLTSSSTPSLFFTGAAGDVLALGGTLYVAQGKNIATYALPLSSGEAPSATVSVKPGQTFDVLATDGSGIYAIGNCFCGKNYPKAIYGFTLPLTSTSEPAHKRLLTEGRRIAANSTTLYITEPSQNAVGTITLPLSSTSPVTQLTSSNGAPEEIALDPSDLYLAAEPNAYSGNLQSYALPFTSGKTASASIGQTSVTSALAVGP